MKYITTVKFLVVFIAITILTMVSCSEDSPTDPKEEKIVSLSSQTITSTGGSIKTDNLEIIFPSGCFKSSKEIKILESTEDNLFGENTLSDFYTLSGLPLEFSEPIKIKIKYTGSLTDSSYIAIGEKNFTSSLNAETTSYKLISAKDSSGYLIATLPPLSNATLEKNTTSFSINADNLSINLGAIVGYVSYKSPQGHFLINTPSSVITQAYDLADYLETAYNKFKTLGFSYDRRTKWPVQVNIKRLGTSVYGYSYNSVWGNNYGYLEFNFDKMDDKENLSVTAGHEFFHLVQSLYDPRNSFSKAKFSSPHLWLDEASSVWSESFFTGSSNYLSPIFSDNAFDVFNGAKTGDDASKAGEYGYGMASMMKYVTKEYGNNKLVDIYNNIYNGKTPFQSISSVLPISMGFSWHSFLRSLVSFDLYSGDTFRPAILLAYSAGEKQKFIIKSASDTVSTYKSKLSDLSATIFSVDNQFSEISKSAFLEFTCKDWDFQIYKLNSSKCVLIDSGKDTLTVGDFKELTEDGYKVIAVLYNDDYNSPYSNEKEYEFKIRVVTPIEFNFVDFRIQTEGEFTSKYNDGTKDSVWTYTSGTFISHLNFDDPQVISINGNNVNCSAQWVHPDGWVYNYQLNLEFNDINNPTSISRFNCQWSETYNDGASVTSNVKSASGINIPLEAEFGELNFRVSGNISNNLLEYSEDYEGYYGIYNPPISRERRLNSFETSNGKISFILRNN